MAAGPPPLFEVKVVSGLLLSHKINNTVPQALLNHMSFSLFPSLMVNLQLSDLQRIIMKGTNEVKL
jgi:hypothetical protein